MNEGAGLDLGFIVLSQSVLTTWGLMVALLIFSGFLSFKLKAEDNPWRTVAETIYTMMENAVKDVVPTHYEQVTPLVSTLWIYLVFANLLGLIPGLSSPTADLSQTTALALIVFVSVHWFGIRYCGLKSYLKHYLSPSPVMLPFHLISELTRTLALAIRLFGNIMSLEMAALLILIVAGFLVPVPLLMLHVIEALIQAYIFGVLSLLYIGSALESHTAEIQTTAEHHQPEQTQKEVNP